MLTIKQAEVIYQLSNQGFMDGVPFTAFDVFPGQNNKDSSCRRVLKNLAQKGIIETELRPDNYDPYKLVNKFIAGEKAVDAFHKFASKRDYDFSCFSL
ncbi:MAG: hypothetical protein ACW97P_10645 [Candidatus Hodarchaeales archaeon]|jgi:hypothetical protein